MTTQKDMDRKSFLVTDKKGIDETVKVAAQISSDIAMKKKITEILRKGQRKLTTSTGYIEEYIAIPVILDDLMAFFHSSTQSAVRKAEERMERQMVALMDVHQPKEVGECYLYEALKKLKKKLLNHSKRG